MENDRLNIKAVTGLTGVSAPTVRRWVAAGFFPAPVVLGPRVHYWPRAQVVEWLTARGVRVAEGA